MGYPGLSVAFAERCNGEGGLRVFFCWTFPGMGLWRGKSVFHFFVKFF